MARYFPPREQPSQILKEPYVASLSFFFESLSQISFEKIIMKERIAGWGDVDDHLVASHKEL